MGCQYNCYCSGVQANGSTLPISLTTSQIANSPIIPAQSSVVILTYGPNSNPSNCDINFSSNTIKINESGCYELLLSGLIEILMQNIGHSGPTASLDLVITLNIQQVGGCRKLINPLGLNNIIINYLNTDTVAGGYAVEHFSISVNHLIKVIGKVVL